MLTEPHLINQSHDISSISSTIADGLEIDIAVAVAISDTSLPTGGRARCSDGAGTLAYLFFSDEDLDVARAKAVCRSCTLREACLSGALDRGESYGVWGGVLLIDGEPARFARRRGRPPTERIEVVADEVPIPAHLVA